MDNRPVICIVGPTASGKSDTAQLVALAVEGEIISADSMQIYRGMDIGTGKVTADKQVVAHYGLDLVDPGQAYSASLFQDYARSCFADCKRRGKTPLLVGGTGLYVRAAIDKYDFPSGDQVGNPVRDYWNDFAEKHGPAALWDELEKRDPESAHVLHPNNVRRVVRAFELLEEGTTYAHQLANLSSIPQFVPARFFGLAIDPEVLKRRIDARVDRMIEEGLVREVEDLIERGFRSGVTAPQAIGYKEIVRALEGEITLNQAIDEIKTATRRYAKRQRTWFKKDSRITWIDATYRQPIETAKAILASLDAKQ